MNKFISWGAYLSVIFIGISCREIDETVGLSAEAPQSIIMIQIDSVGSHLTTENSKKMDTEEIDPPKKDPIKW